MSDAAYEQARQIVDEAFRAWTPRPMSALDAKEHFYEGIVARLAIVLRDREGEAMREQRDMSGVLFRDHDKKSERAPDYTGTAMIAGTAYRIAGWIKTAKNGRKFFSLAFSEPNERRERPSEERPQEAPQDDDIPF